MTKKKSKKSTKRAAKGRIGKKRVANKKAKRKAKKKSAKSSIPAGYQKTSAGLLAPTGSSTGTPVKPAKIESGLSKARGEIDSLIVSLGDLTDGYSVKEIELAVSFSADGKFLGVGVGGATSIKMRFAPDG